MISHNSIDTELRFYQTVQERMRADLLTFPKGDVFFKLEHGRKRPYTKINGRKKYLGTRNIEYVQRVMQRKEYEKSLYLIGQNIEALHALRSRFHDLVHIVPASFALPDKFLSRKERAAIAERWAEVRKVQVLPPETFARKGEKTPRKFKTSDGIYVKSRAELFIYEYLKAHGIMFLYERPFHANGKTYYPDFTIIRASDGEMILWEHFGMMSLDWYLRNTQEKLYDYSCEGFWPFRNIIATYEFNEDDLDASEIERILKMMEIL